MRMGRWITTYTGGSFSFDYPRVADIDLRDIAVSLSRQTRWGGHLSHFYSIAQHSVLVARQVPEEFRLHALMHDATECYIGDISRPLKQLLGEPIHHLEDQIWQLIVEKFWIKLSNESIDAVREADARMLKTEALLLAEDGRAGHSLVAEPYSMTIIPWSPVTARRAFLESFYTITGKSTKAQLKPFLRSGT